jgi:hypothetical protein
MMLLLAFAMLPPAHAEWIAWQTQDPVKIASAYFAELLPAYRTADEAKLTGLFTPDCVFGDPDAGKFLYPDASNHKDVLAIGMKSVGMDHTDKDFREKVIAMTVMSAVSKVDADWETDLTGTKHPIRVTAWVKVEVLGGLGFYQWAVLTQFEGAENGWTCMTVLKSPAPVDFKTPVAAVAATAADLLEQPVKAVGDAGVSTPAPQALVATFACGVLLSGCFFGRKELFARFMAPTGLQEPLLSESNTA